jgi:hypothetical protein
MCTSADTVLTTTSITAVSVSMLNAQSTLNPPGLDPAHHGTRDQARRPSATVKKAIQDRSAATPGTAW